MSNLPGEQLPKELFGFEVTSKNQSAESSTDIFSMTALNMEMNRRDAEGYLLPPQFARTGDNTRLYPPLTGRDLADNDTSGLDAEFYEPTEGEGK